MYLLIYAHLYEVYIYIHIYLYRYIHTYTHTDTHIWLTLFQSGFKTAQVQIAESQAEVDPDSIFGSYMPICDLETWQTNIQLSLCLSSESGLL